MIAQVYDFALPLLILHAFTFKTMDNLKHWLNICPRRQITVLDTHDGMGIDDIAGLAEVALSPSQRFIIPAYSLVHIIKACRSGLCLYHSTSVHIIKACSSALCLDCPTCALLQRPAQPTCMAACLSCQETSTNHIAGVNGAEVHSEVDPRNCAS